MIRSNRTFFLSVKCIAPWPRARQFSTSARRLTSSANRIYTQIRTPEELHTLLLLSSSSYKPLITLWTASWCRSCAEIAPIVRKLIEEEKVGEAEGGLGYAEVDLWSSTIGDLGVQYTITSVPTLMAFSRSEPQVETRITKVDELKRREFLVEWLRKEARRGGMGGAGGSGSSFLKKVFGS